MQAISTRPFSCALYWKRYMRQMRSGDELRMVKTALNLLFVMQKYARILH